MRAFTPRTKYGAKPTNGYASKREADYAQQLEWRKLATNGDVLEWIEQVPIKLPGGVKYVVDFMVIMRDRTVRFIEVKGFETETWKLKMKALQAARPDIYKLLEVVE